MSVYTETADGLMLPRSRHLSESRHADALTIALLESRLGDLERQLQEDGWTRLDGDAGREFNRAGQDKIVELARVHYLKNPIIRRGVEIAALYVFGQDLSINAEDERVEAVIDRFWRDNRSTLTGQQASRLLEVELEVTGNVFLALFPNIATGEVRVRTVPMEEVRQIVTNPEDRSDVWYYVRKWTETPVEGGNPKEMIAYYPDWRHKPVTKPASVTVDGREVEIRWDSPFVHVKAGAFPHWRWGVSEVYAALDWARAYKEQLEDDATRSRALARFAWKLSTKGGRTGVAAAKTRLGTTYGTAGSGAETNPAPVAGSTWIQGEGVDLDPIRIAGATLDPDHSRPARLMAASALGLPDTFFGDVDQGTLATAKSLDRPTELRFSERREMWLDVFDELCQYVIDADLAASSGLLGGMKPNVEQRKVECSFPSLLEPDVVARVDAVGKAAPHLPDLLTARLMMVALEVEDIDGELAKLEQEQAERERKAAEIAKQVQPQPPAPNEPPQPTAPREAKVTITDDDLADAAAWWDKRLPQVAGALNQPPKKDDE